MLNPYRCAYVPPVARDAVRNPIRPETKRFRERARVAFVRLHPATPRGVHRRVIGIGDNDRMPECLEVPRHPFTFCCRLEQHARRRPLAQHRGESLATRHDATVRDRAVLGEDAELTLAFVQIESYRIHWLASPVCASSQDDEHVLIVWGEPCHHVSVEVQPLHTN